MLATSILQFPDTPVPDNENVKTAPKLSVDNTVTIRSLTPKTPPKSEPLIKIVSPFTNPEPGLLIVIE